MKLMNLLELSKFIEKAELVEIKTKDGEIIFQNTEIAKNLILQIHSDIDENETN